MHDDSAKYYAYTLIKVALNLRRNVKEAYTYTLRVRLDIISIKILKAMY